MIVAIAGFAFNCKSVDKANVGGKEVIVASEMNPVIFTVWGAPVTKCIEAVKAEGATKIANANQSIVGNLGALPAGTNGLYSSSRLSSTEACQATGIK